MDDVSVTELMGYIIYRVNVQSNKSLSMVGKKIFENEFDDKDDFTVEDAVVMMHTLVLTKE